MKTCEYPDCKLQSTTFLKTKCYCIVHFYHIKFSDYPMIIRNKLKKHEGKK